MELQSLIMGAVCLATGVPMIILPRRSRLAAEAKSAARKAQLAAGASERFFEERRSLEAYPPAATDGRWGTKGALLTACGIALIVLSLVR